MARQGKGKPKSVYRKPRGPSTSTNKPHKARGARERRLSQEKSNKK